MQVFRLVNGGRVDKMIAFDSLPKRFMAGIRTKGCDGLPRFWTKWLADAGSLCDVFKTSTTKDAQNNYYYTYTKIGTKPCTFILEYLDVNADKEKWQEICSYIKKAVDLKTRLMDKIEDMAVPMAPDCHAPMSLEPEDIPVILVPHETEPSISEEEGSKKVSDEDLKVSETVLEAAETASKKRGRPRKVVEGVTQ